MAEAAADAARTDFAARTAEYAAERSRAAAEAERERASLHAALGASLEGLRSGESASGRAMEVRARGRCCREVS